jgi:hypothetical protein
MCLFDIAVTRPCFRRRALIGVPSTTPMHDDCGDENGDNDSRAYWVPLYHLIPGQSDSYLIAAPFASELLLTVSVFVVGS